MGALYANRGARLEELIRYTNIQYRRKGVARIDRFPTPIDPEQVTRAGKVLGHFAEKSTVDFIGTLKSGRFVCFDCKETAEGKRFPLANIHLHQIEYMRDAYAMGGIAFLLVCFTKLDRYFRLRFPDLWVYWETYAQDAGGTRRVKNTASIPLEDAAFFEVKPEVGYPLHYLRGIAD